MNKLEAATPQIKAMRAFILIVAIALQNRKPHIQFIGCEHLLGSDQAASLLPQTPSRLEDVSNDCSADREESDRDREGNPYVDISRSIERPAQAAHEIDYRVRQRDRVPWLGQHIDGIESAAEKGQRCQEKERNDPQFLEIVRPDTQDETEQ